MLPGRQLLGGDAEGLILSLVARHRAEEMTVELHHQPGQRSATRFVEPRLADVFSRSLGDVEAECSDAVQLEDRRQEAVRERFGITSGARQLLRARDVPRGIDDDSRSRRGSRRTRARARPNDSPDDISDVHNEDDEEDHEKGEADAVPGGMLLREAVEPVSKPVPLLEQPAEYAMTFHPLEFGTREHLAHHASQRIGRERSLENQRAPSCSLRIWMSKASRRTRRS